MIVNQEKMQFNNFANISRVPNEIINKLFDNENIWKLLYYTYDDVTKSPVNNPLSMPNLTAKTKRSLIYLGTGTVENFRVFFTTYPMQAQFKSQSQQIRIVRGRTDPANAFMSNVSWVFELPCHEDVQTIINNEIPCNRVDLLQEEIMKTLNGAYVGGTGQLQFNRDSSVGFNDYSSWVDFGGQFSGMAFSMSNNFYGSEGYKSCSG